jgi:stage II sporulation protein R
MLRKIMIVILAVTLLGGAAYYWQQQSAASKAYSVENLIRLHVVANSDSLADQQVKYLIRDRLVNSLTPALSQAKNAGQARRLIEARRSEINRLAEQTLRAQGLG